MIIPDQGVRSQFMDSSPAKSKTKQLINLLSDKWGERLLFNTATSKPELDGKPLDLFTLPILLAMEFDIDVSKAKATQVVLYIAKKKSF